MLLRSNRLSRCLSYSNRLSTSSLSRLQTVSNLKGKSELLYKLRTVYTSNNINFLEEFIDNYTPQFKDLLERLHVKEVSKYINQNIVDLILRGERQKVEAIEGLLAFPTNQKDFIDRLIRELVGKNEILTSFECIVKLLQNGVIIRYDTIVMLLDSLKYVSEADFAKVSYATLQLYNHYKELKVDELTKILTFLTDSIHGNYFANYVYNDLKATGKFKEFTPRTYNDAVYCLLNVNLKNMNPYKCLEIWNDNKDNLNPSENVSLLLRIVRLCNENGLDGQEILAYLPSEQIQVLNYKLEYYGQCLDRKPQFQETVKQISKLERSTMTSLLSSFLSYGEEENSEKVIQTIFKSSSGINKYEVDLIVQKLLKQKKFEEAMRMVENMSWYDSQLAYVSLFKYVLENQCQMNGQVDVFWTDLRDRLKDIQTDEIAKLLTIEMLRHITKKDPRDGIRNYVKFVEFSNNSTASDNLYSDLKLKNYGIPNWFKRYISLNDKTTMLKTCRVMVPYILQWRNYWTTIWIFNEFRKLGWDLPSIFKLLKSSDSKNYLSGILKPKVIKSISNFL